MRLGIENISRSVETDLLGAHGLRFRPAPPSLLLTDPTEALVCQQIGGGQFLADDHGKSIGGDVVDSLVVITDRRLVHVTTKGTVDGAPIDSETSANVFVVDVPLSEIESIGVNVEKRVLRKGTPSTVAIASSHFGLRFEPRFDVSDGPSVALSDPWPLSQNLADLVMIGLRIPEAERATLHQSHWASEPSAFTFAVDPLRKRPTSAPATPLAPRRLGLPEPVAPEPAPLIASAPPEVTQTDTTIVPVQPEPQALSPLEVDITVPRTQIGESAVETATLRSAVPSKAADVPVLPVYVVADAALAQVDPRVASKIDELWGMAAAASPASLRTALVVMGPAPSLDTVLSPPLIGGGIVAAAGGAPRHAETAMFLADLLDHDLNWFKDTGSPVLRPIVLFVTGGGEAIPDSASCRLTDQTWNFRPNLVFIGAGPHCSAAVASVPVSYSTISDVPGADVSSALAAVWGTIVESAQRVDIGEAAALRFPEAMAGFSTRNG